MKASDIRRGQVRVGDDPQNRPHFIPGNTGEKIEFKLGYRAGSSQWLATDQP